MLYKDKMQKDMSEYEVLLEKYKSHVESDEYSSALHKGRFLFIKAIALCDVLAIAKIPEAKMTFSSAAEAEALFKSLVNFKKEKDGVLELAYVVERGEELREEANAIVAGNPLLSDALLLEEVDEAVIGFANECLQKLPQYDQLLTKAFAVKFTESCIESLPLSEIEELLPKRIIREEYLDKARATGSPEYIEKLSTVCSFFGKDRINVEESVLKVKGCSFQGEQGHSRQDILSRLYNSQSKGVGECVEIVKCLFAAEGEDPKPALKILYQGKDIGYVPQATATKMDALEKELSLSVSYVASIAQVEGGEDGVPFGAKINFGAYAVMPSALREKAALIAAK